MSNDYAQHCQDLGWQLAVERDPDWVFIHVHPPESDDSKPPLAADCWDLMQKAGASRVVLEMDEVPRLNSHLVGQLVMLHKRVHTAGGMMRLSGVLDGAQQVLQLARLDSRFPAFASRQDAIRGFAPAKPR